MGTRECSGHSSNKAKEQKQGEVQLTARPTEAQRPSSFKKRC